MFEKSKLAKAIVNDDAEMIRQIGRRKGAHFFHESLSDYGYPISRALRMDKRAALDAMLECGASVSAAAGNYPNALHAAVYYNRTDYVKKWMEEYSSLVDSRDYWGRTLLHRAAEAGNADMVVYLMGAGLDSEAKDSEGHTALYYAQEGRHEDVSLLLKPYQEKAAQRRRSSMKLLEPAGERDPWKKLGEDRIAHVSEETDIGQRLTRIFNFTAQDCVIIARNLETGAETMAVRSLHDSGFSAMVEEARAMLEQRGGKAVPAPAVLLPAWPRKGGGGQG